MSPFLSLVLLVAVVFAVVFAFGMYRAYTFRSASKSRSGVSVSGEASRGRFLGKGGVAVTPLRPEGIVVVHGSRLEATTEGEFIAAGSRVRIVAMGRGQYVVRLDADA